MNNRKNVTNFNQVKNNFEWHNFPFFRNILEKTDNDLKIIWKLVYVERNRDKKYDVKAWDWFDIMSNY